MNDKEQKLEADIRRARHLAIMFRNIASTLDVLIAAAQTAAPSAANDNVYLRRGEDEHQLREIVAQALNVTGWGGVHHMMRYKYQWYALYRSLEQRGRIAGRRRGLTQFCRQMHEWFPDSRVPFDYKGVAKGGEHRHDLDYERARQWFETHL